MPNKRTTIKFDVFEFTFTVIRAKDVERTAKRLGADATGGRACFVSDEDQPKRGWIVLRVDATPGAIAHESFHAVWHMLKYAGVEMEEETFAYHLHHLVAGIHKFIDKSGK